MRQRDYITLSPGKLNDALARLGLKHRDAIVVRNTRIIEGNLKVAADWIAERPYLSWTPPRGGLLAHIKNDLEVPSLEQADRPPTRRRERAKRLKGATGAAVRTLIDLGMTAGA